MTSHRGRRTRGLFVSYRSEPQLQWRNQPKTGDQERIFLQRRHHMLGGVKLASDPGRPECCEPPFRILILSDTRFLAEGLAQALECDDRVSSCWCCTDLHEGLAKLADARPEIVLLDAALQWGLEAV